LEINYIKYWLLYNFIKHWNIMLIVPKITLVNCFDYKWMCNWSFMKGEMKLGHGYILHVLKISIRVKKQVM